MKPRSAVWQYVERLEREPRMRHGGRGEVVVCTLRCGHVRRLKASKAPKTIYSEPHPVTGLRRVLALGLLLCHECTEKKAARQAAEARTIKHGRVLRPAQQIVRAAKVRRPPPAAALRAIARKPAGRARPGGAGRPHGRRRR